ncbi:MAG: gluconate 2-dehydrogenase subunit 3 family protein [Eudoraea sp.]|uniref:gluconate 2-dehydrogenase subunit 3 family protein n=1 Tax=Eudoraea sp. TaxID=1979955 RepID=UPI003C793245
MEKINRRNAMGILARWSAGSFIPFSWILEGCTYGSSLSLFNKEYQSLLGAIVEIILPETDESPGAKEANVQYFIALIVEDCYEIENKDRILVGLNQLLKDGFLDFSAQKKYEVIEQLDIVANSSTQKIPHYFKDLKSLTQWGYFSSKIGITKGLRYNPIPEYYKGCVPYNGEIAWYS